MGGLLPFVVFVGVLAAVLGLFTWLASVVRRRGLAGGAVSAALASYEEAFRVTAHESHVEIRAQAERKTPVPTPDGQGEHRRYRADGRSVERRGPRGRRRRLWRRLWRRRGR